MNLYLYLYTAIQCKSVYDMLQFSDHECFVSSNVSFLRFTWGWATIPVIQSSRGRHRGGSAQSAARRPPPSLYCKARLMSSWTMSETHTHTQIQHSVYIRYCSGPSVSTSIYSPPWCIDLSGRCCRCMSICEADSSTNRPLGTTSPY